MSHARWSAVDRYFSELLVPPDPTLDEVLRRNARAGLPSHEVTPSQGKLLFLLARIQGARRILEIGTLGGYSAIWLARALPPDGRLLTLESEAAHAQVARRNLSHVGLADLVEVRVGPAVETLAELSREGAGPFDLIFIDADKPSNPDYLARSLELSREGTVIVADNVVREGEVANPASEDPSVRGVRRFTERLAEEPRVSATVVQTVGTKGWDGFAIAVVGTAD